jgi:uncharacterized membrane protein YbhN (UPF0104 family)
VRNAIRLLVGVAVSAACLYFATRGTDWSQVGVVLANTKPAWVLLVVVASVTSIWVRALRWRVLLRPLGDVPVYPAFSATAIGFGASAVLPFRAGEFVRPWLLARHTGIRMSAALSSVVLERLFDVLLVIGCFLLLALLYPIPSGLRDGAWLLGAGGGGALLALILLQSQRARAEALLARVFGLLPARVSGAVEPLASSFLDGLGGLRDIRTVLLVLAYSVYVWGVITLTFMFSYPALGIVVPWVPAALATVVSVAAAVFLPQAPGFVGTWQAGCVLALGLFGVEKELAVGYSLLTWVIQMGVNIGTSGFFIAREDFSVGQMMRLAREKDEATGMEAK